DLGQFRHGHDILPAEMLHQRRYGLFSVFVLQSTLHCLRFPLLLLIPFTSPDYLSSDALQCLQLRVLVPSGRTAWPMRVCLLQLPQTTMTLETWIAASFSTMPPLMFLVGFGRVWRFMMATCSTTTRFFFASIESTRPLLPASGPEITRTLSPLRIWMVCRSVLSC